MAPRKHAAVYLDSEVIQRIDEIAAIQNVTRSEMINTCITEWLIEREARLEREAEARKRIMKEFEEDASTFFTRTKKTES